ncbi:response regulator [Rubrimonas cliftonensis]|uniref:Response regulator receiver domain-containing protein n=1 Tax=Rubrimonas cliftonensis TaxID=89524 RepID=A0A1H3X8Q8_9RHOB|nr:response regulator [Rubrimonas cliftonensis]SDZ95022.1 Response regulator receiver domain-containing protein [Rubrimonas cliftonensis]
MSEKRRVAIVENDVLLAYFLREIVELDLGAEVVGVAHTADEASAMLERQRPDWVLIELRLGGARDGVDVSIDYLRLKPDGRIIFITASSEPGVMRRIGEDHAYRVLTKPIDPTSLIAAFD